MSWLIQLVKASHINTMEYGLLFVSLHANSNKTTNWRPYRLLNPAIAVLMVYIQLLLNPLGTQPLFTLSTQFLLFFHILPYFFYFSIYVAL